MIERNPETKSRLLARLVRELLRSESFDGLADLTDALKFRCAVLKIPWTNDDINDAYRLIASNTPLPGRVLVRRRLVEREPDPPVIDRETAARFMRDLPTAIKGVQAAVWSDPEQSARELEAARERAAEIGIEL